MSAPQAATHAAAPAGQKAPLPRQYVNFSCYKLDPAFLRLSERKRRKAAAEFQAALEKFSDKVMLLPFSTVGVRAEMDFFLWRIAWTLEDLEAQSAAIRKTVIGAHLSQPQSFLAMTKRSIYVDKINPEHEGQRTRVVPGKYKYLFVYPFVKSREWYLLSLEERQKMMDAHIEVGNRFPSVKLNTTYSFGLDDQDFVVAFESDQPGDFVDLVMALRETQGSKYTVRDTPIITGLRKPLPELLAAVCGL
jgi:chlorite dismutase